MSVFLITGFFVSFFLSFIVFSKKKKIIADKLLIIIFLIYALTIGGTYLEIYNNQNNYPFPHLTNFNWVFLFLHGPLLWLYVKSLTVRNFKFNSYDLLHFLPFIIFFVYHFFDFMSLPAETKISISKNETFSNRSFFSLVLICIGISNLGYNIFSLILLRKHQKLIKDNYSHIENKDLRWLQTFLIASLLIFIVNVSLYNINNYLKFTTFNELSKYSYIFATLYVFYLAYFGIKQGEVFADNIEANFETNLIKSDNPLYIKIEHKDTIHKLLFLMEKEQPYLDPEITLAKLSNYLNIKPELLTEVLNSSLNNNFFDFINKHRIEEFKIKCVRSEFKHLSIIGIAYECGFNSKASFYRAFKKFEGISPSEYISKVSLKSETSK